MRIGDRFTKEVAFTEDSIRQFATYVGDSNPLHHDQVAAVRVPVRPAHRQRNADILDDAGGAARLSAAGQPNVGLEASVRLLRPVHAGDRARIEWEVTDIADTPKLKGWIVAVSGRLVRDDGVVALTATSKSLVYWPDAMRR
jgi:3-hydroxybutyryl-CoA dehydratase